MLPQQQQKSFSSPYPGTVFKRPQTPQITTPMFLQPEPQEVVVRTSPLKSSASTSSVPPHQQYHFQHYESNRKSQSETDSKRHVSFSKRIQDAQRGSLNEELKVRAGAAGADEDKDPYYYFAADEVVCPPGGAQADHSYFNTSIKKPPAPIPRVSSSSNSGGSRAESQPSASTILVGKSKSGGSSSSASINSTSGSQMQTGAVKSKSSKSSSLHGVANSPLQQAAISLKNFGTKELFTTRYSQLLPSTKAVDPIFYGNYIEVERVHEKFNGNEATMDLTEEQKVPTLDASKVAETVCKLQGRFNQLNNEDWIEKLPKALWTHKQCSLFERMLRLINDYRLQYLVFESHPNRNIYQWNAVRKATQEFKQICAALYADESLLKWVHRTLFDRLPCELLAGYLEILAAVRNHTTLMIDRLVNAIEYHSIKQELWKYLQSIQLHDPAAETIDQHPFPPLAKSPVFIVMPPFPVIEDQPGVGHNGRWELFKAHMLSKIGECVYVDWRVPGKKTTAEKAVEAGAMAIRSAVLEARTVHRDRPTVLIGWNAGAVLALRAALEAPVHACVCFAFANLTIDGLRCDIDDDFYDLTCPVLFVVGQFSSTCDINTLQDFRSGCKAITGLLVVGGADDELRMGSEKLQMEALTQSMVDRCILDESMEFIGDAIQLPLRPNSQTTISNAAKKSADGAEGLNGKHAKKRSYARKEKEKESELGETEKPLKFSKKKFKPTKVLDPEWKSDKKIPPISLKRKHTEVSGSASKKEKEMKRKYEIPQGTVEIPMKRPKLQSRDQNPSPVHKKLIGGSPASFPPIKTTPPAAILSGNPVPSGNFAHRSANGPAGTSYNKGRLLVHQPSESEDDDDDSDDDESSSSSSSTDDSDSELLDESDTTEDEYYDGMPILRQASVKGNRLPKQKLKTAAALISSKSTMKREIKLKGGESYLEAFNYRQQQQ